MNYFHKVLSITFAWFFLFIVHCSLLHAQIYSDSADLNKITSAKELTSFLEGIYQKTLDKGVPNLIPYSLYLAQESHNALKQRKYERAEILSEYAQKLSPDIPAVYLARAEAQWSKNKLHVNTLFQGYTQALVRSLDIRNIDDLCFFIFTNLSALAGAFFLTLSIFACISLIKYLKLLVHDLRHVLPVVPRIVVFGMTLIALVLPLFLGFSIFWMCICWLILLFPYHSKNERYVLAGLFGLCALVVPLIIAALSFSITVPQSEPIRLLWKANYGSLNQQDIESLESLLASSEADQDILFSLGLVNKKETNYRTSYKYYEKLIKLNPRDYKAHTNMGNILLALQKWDEAIAHYQEAIASNPLLSAAAHFNFARAYQQKFMFKEAEKELEEAKKIDRSRVDRYLKIYSENYNRMLIDETIPMQKLWERGYLLFSQDLETAQDVWNLLFRGISLPSASIILLALYCGSLIILKKGKFRLATTCKMCGKPLCKRCQRVVTADIICSQCQNFLKKQATLGYKLKEEKVSSIKRYLRSEKLIRTVLVWFIPGAGHIWKGQPVTGTIYLFLWCTLILKIGCTLFFESPWGIIAPLGFAEVLTLSAVLILFWLWVSSKALKLKSKEVEDNILLRNILSDI